MNLQQRYEKINQNIEKACLYSGRKPADVTLIAVTKTRSAAEINEAIALGICTIGENRVQELLEKYDSLDPRASVHLIGQLQTNKVKYIIDKVDMIHSLDRISLAQQLEKLAEQAGRPPVKVLVEVNIGNEPTKSGVLPENLSEYLDSLQNFRYIKPMGLMTVAPACASEDELERYFAKMRSLLQEGVQRFGSDFAQLSMGMSHDYEAAIRQGATMIRIGTALFGERNYNI